MAHLLRVTRQNDSFNSQTFTFLLPHAACRSDDAIEIASRDFCYSGHKFYLSLTKSQDNAKERAFLTPNLHIRTLHSNTGMHVTLDVTFVLVNRLCFLRNEIFSKKRVEFRLEQLDLTDTSSLPGYSKKEFISLEDMVNCGFTDCRGEFLFELILRSCVTTYQCDIQLTHDPNSSRDPLDYQRYDGQIFVFGDLKWSWVFCPNMDLDKNGLMRHMLQVVRKTRFDTLCKLTYRILLVDKSSNHHTSESNYRSKYICDPRAEIFDFSGNGDGVYFTEGYLSYISPEGRITFAIELYDIVHLNHIRLNVLSTLKQPVAQIFDKEKQAWRLSLNYPNADEKNNDQLLYVKFAYVDSSNVPRSYGRYVAWNMQIIPQSHENQDNAYENADSSKTVIVGQPVTERYYSTVGRFFEDKFFTNIKLRELKKPDNCWLHKLDQRLLIQIEWLSSHLFFEPCYCVYDDIYRKQIMQMRHELLMLQSQNTLLERDLYINQVTVAEKPPREAVNDFLPRTPSVCSISSAKDSGKDAVLQSLVSSTILAASSVALNDVEQDDQMHKALLRRAQENDNRQWMAKSASVTPFRSPEHSHRKETSGGNIQRRLSDRRERHSPQSQKAHRHQNITPQNSTKHKKKPVRKLTPEILISPGIDNGGDEDDDENEIDFIHESRRKLTEPNLIGSSSKHRSRSFANFLLPSNKSEQYLVDSHDDPKTPERTGRCRKSSCILENRAITPTDDNGHFDFYQQHYRKVEDSEIQRTKRTQQGSPSKIRR